MLHPGNTFGSIMPCYVMLIFKKSFVYMRYNDLAIILLKCISLHCVVNMYKLKILKQQFNCYLLKNI